MVCHLRQVGFLNPPSGDLITYTILESTLGINLKLRINITSTVIDQNTFLGLSGPTHSWSDKKSSSKVQQAQRPLAQNDCSQSHTDIASLSDIAAGENRDLPPQKKRNHNEICGADRIQQKQLELAYAQRKEYFDLIQDEVDSQDLVNGVWTLEREVVYINEGIGFGSKGFVQENVHGCYFQSDGTKVNGVHVVPSEVQGVSYPGYCLFQFKFSEDLQEIKVPLVKTILNLETRDTMDHVTYGKRNNELVHNVETKMLYQIDLYESLMMKYLNHVDTGANVVIFRKFAQRSAGHHCHTLIDQTVAVFLHDKAKTKETRTNLDKFLQTETCKTTHKHENELPYGEYQEMLRERVDPGLCKKTKIENVIFEGEIKYTNNEKWKCVDRMDVWDDLAKKFYNENPVKKSSFFVTQYFAFVGGSNTNFYSIVNDNIPSALSRFQKCRYAEVDEEGNLDDPKNLALDKELDFKQDVFGEEVINSEYFPTQFFFDRTFEFLLGTEHSTPSCSFTDPEYSPGINSEYASKFKPAGRMQQWKEFLFQDVPMTLDTHDHMAKVLSSILHKVKYEGHANLYADCVNTWEDPDLFRADWANLPHTVRKARVAFEKIMKDSSEAERNNFKAQMKLKKEGGKYMKATRFYVTYNESSVLVPWIFEMCKHSMDGIWAPDGNQYDTLDDVPETLCGATHVVLYPTPSKMQEIFRDFTSVKNGDRGNFTLTAIHGDDTAVARYNDGKVSISNIDISSCDASNGKGIFHVMEEFIKFLIPNKDLKLIKKQHRKPFMMENPEKPGECVFFERTDGRPTMGSGSNWTTFMNSTANLGLSMQIIHSDDEHWEDACADLGYIITNEKVESVHGIQFLKRSKCTGGTYLNLGVMFRNFGTIENQFKHTQFPFLTLKEFTIRMSTPEGENTLMEMYMASIVEGMKNEPSSTILSALRERFPTNKPCVTEKRYHELGGFGELTLSDINKRYGIDELDVEELCAYIINLKVGDVIRCNAIDAFLHVDYGFPMPVL